LAWIFAPRGAQRRVIERRAPPAARRGACRSESGGRRKGGSATRPLRPDATGVTDARTREPLRKVNFSNSAAGAAVAPGSASRQAPLGLRGPERHQERRATSAQVPLGDARRAAHLISRAKEVLELSVSTEY
jgi:hypothetical protein